jgi:xylulokinase
MAVYLGFDSSTQGLSVTAISIDGGCCEVLFEDTLNFDETLPEYGTRHGVLPGGDPRVVHAPPLMWAEALDVMMARIARRGIPLREVAAISGAAQQHGSVYLTLDVEPRLASLAPAQPLAFQLHNIWSRPTAPVWLDSSTSASCAAITAAAGGAMTLARRTGSRAFERFTGPQIHAFARQQPEAYGATGQIHLVSSFMASLLVGGHAPLEPGDASGMNLMELGTGAWAQDLLAVTAPDLAAKLPPIVPSSTVVGTLARYWRERYGFPAAPIVAWTGDNPSSLIGLGLVDEGHLGVSLGTSDTVFGAMREPRVDPDASAHVFGAPTGEFMGLTCFANGSLARERLRDAYGLDWNGFSNALRATPPGNDGALMLPWFAPEVTPAVASPGVRRSGIPPDDVPSNVRAVVEAQMMSIWRHSRWMGVATSVLHVTGGAAVNRDILQVLADVAGVPVMPLESSNAASLGAALRAWHAIEAEHGGDLTWDAVVSPFVRVAPGRPVHPRLEHRATYDALMRSHAAFETASATQK